MILRDYQQELRGAVAAVLRQGLHPLAQLDTGAGKTPVIADLAAEFSPFLIIAHRKELVEQISETLAINGMEHAVIAAQDTKRECAKRHKQNGVMLINQHSENAVVSLDTLNSHHRLDKLQLATDKPYTIFIDEGHHAADDNKWVKTKYIFQHAKYCGFTATPGRLDGSSLHIDDGGLYHEIVQADSLKKDSIKTLISAGYLADFKAYGIPSNINLTMLDEHGNDYTQASLNRFARSNLFMIDSAIGAWKRYAQNKKTLVFAPSIESAEYFTNEYHKHRISATYIASSLSASENKRRINLFKLGVVKVLLSVDMICEGFDLPEIEAIQMLRPTASLMLYRQMCGRLLRPADGKLFGIILDHVMNCEKFGLPDTHIEWDIHGLPKAFRVLQLPCKVMHDNPLNDCDFIYNAYGKKCPECGRPNLLFEREDFENIDKIYDPVYIPMQLVQLARQQIKKVKEQERLNSTPLPPRWKYTQSHNRNIVDVMCDNLAAWFYEQLLKTDLAPAQINGFTQGPIPDKKEFWFKSFSAKDLKTSNPAKCKKALEEWQLK